MRALLFCICVFLKIFTVHSQWAPNFFNVDEDDRVSKKVDEWTTQGQFGKVDLEFDEEVDAGFVLGELNLPGTPSPSISSDKFELDKNQLRNKYRFNYEKSEEQEASFKVTVGQVVVTFTITIRNINDEPLRISQAESCKIPEGGLTDLPTCKYILKDLDGLSERLKLNNFDAEYNSIFNFVCEACTGKKEATVGIKPLNDLDYEKVTRYIFDWVVMDEEHNDTARVIVEVDDRPDQPPMWTDIQVSNQFDEETPMTFNFKAIDGDLGCNDEIVYECKNIQEELKEFMTWKEVNKWLEIDVKAIDRDKDNLSILKFTVEACEKNFPNECTEKEIIFLINDLNDNVPKITITGLVPIEFDENKYVTLKMDIEIKDLDLASAGTFDVRLEGPSAPDVKTAMQIIPNTGYRNGTFSISITNASILDYDRTDVLRDFEIEIVAVEKADTSHKCSKTVNMKLINWNDEEPKFTEEKYEIEVSELFGRDGVENLVIPNLIAIDEDYGDYVTYVLIGSGIDNILKLEVNNNNEVIISSKLQSNPGVQLFDFEKQEVVKFQVEASDNLGVPKHKKYAEINVQLKDENDETPILTLSVSSVKIHENREDGYELPDVIVTATDADKEAKLYVEIDWDNSYATKYGQKIEIFNTDYKNSFELVPKKKDGNKVTSTIIVRDVVSRNTPDYEKFDTIYLRILVTDKAQTRPFNANQATLIILVEDVNDNEPKFVEEVMNVQRRVKENSEIHSTIGMVAAKDDDVNSNLTFTLKEEGGTPVDLVTIDSDNQVIKVNGQIDAEDLCNIHKTKVLKYSVCVADNDDVNIVCEEMKIDVIDENDEKPEFVTVPGDVKIKEHSPKDTHVLQISARDNDRDDPNNKILYSFEEKETERYFEISDTGLITVTADLDRDGPPEIASFDIIVVMQDNPVNEKEKKTEKSKTFKIILEDINDNKPIIKTTEIKTRENAKMGDSVGNVEADDADEPGSPNAQIDFKILGLSGCPEGLDKTFFNIETDDKHLSKVGKITALKPLRGYFTDCTIIIKTNDFGKDPGQLEHTNELKLIIDKYNFDPPEFTYPTKNSLYLKPKQPSGQRVRLYDNSELGAIRAKHEKPDKYPIKFSLASDSEGKDVFEFKEESTSSAYLYLKQGYDGSKSYNVVILAQDEGDPPLSSTFSVKIGFYDTEMEPVFKEKDREINFTLKETSEGVGAQIQVPEASLDVDDPSIVGELHLYYYKYEDLNKAFDVDKDTRVVTLKEPIFYPNLASKVLKVVASKGDNGFPAEVSPASIVTINLQVIDINDNPPVFNETQYTGGVMAGYEKYRSVVNVAAYDLDTDTTLTYSILEETYDAKGTAISKYDHKFLLNKDTGIITLDFEVQQNMKGYFIFDVQVSDTEHTDTTNVKIYIISDDNEVGIRFDNPFEDISARRLDIQNILSDFMGYNCTVHGIVEAADENGKTIEGVTEAKTHCIDRESNLPINKDTIKAQMNNAKLKGIFREQLLFMTEIRNVIIPENMEEQLKIWLICVSVVLGSFCVLLIVGFIVKTKSLMTRISKLTTVDFADDEKNANDASAHVPAAPNTNRRAVEGSNPVFNTNFEDREENDYDRRSISSDDSDFLGIENNPVFDD